MRIKYLVYWNYNRINYGISIFSTLEDAQAFYKQTKKLVFDDNISKMVCSNYGHGMVEEYDISISEIYERDIDRYTSSFSVHRPHNESFRKETNEIISAQYYWDWDLREWDDREGLFNRDFKSWKE